MKSNYYFFYLFVILVSLFSCNTNEPTVDFGYNYFPTDTGRYYIYNVDSIWHDCNGTIDTTFYQVKEYYESTFIDASGNNAIRIERYYRSDSTALWNTMTPDVWFLNKNTTRLEKVEENLRIVKMTYPIDETYLWNGNAYNTLDPQFYLYGNNNISFNNGYSQFDSTITVFQLIDTNIIEHYLYSETYARNIGMIYKQKINIEASIIYDQNDITPPTNSCYMQIPQPYNWYEIYILNRIRLGWILKYRLIEYGFE